MIPAFAASVLLASGCSSGGTATGTPSPDFIGYVLDETSGTTAHDSSPHRYDITNLAGVTWSAGAHFDGTGGGGATTVDPSYRSPPITLSGWLTPSARADSLVNPGHALVPFPPSAISNDVPGQCGYGLGLAVWTDGTPGTALAAEDVGMGSCQPPLLGAQLGTVFVAGTEYFIAVSVGPLPSDGSPATASIYVNGQSVSTGPSARLTPADPTTIYLGTHNDDTAYGTRRFFAGRMRDLRVYRRQLGAAEIQQLFMNGPTLHAPARAAGSTDAGRDGSD